MSSQSTTNHCFTDAALRNTWLLAKAAAAYYRQYLTLPYGVKSLTTEILIFATYPTAPMTCSVIDDIAQHPRVYAALRSIKTELVPFLVKDEKGKPKEKPLKRGPAKQGPMKAKNHSTIYPTPSLMPFINDSFPMKMKNKEIKKKEKEIKEEEEEKERTPTPTDPQPSLPHRHSRLPVTFTPMKMEPTTSRYYTAKKNTVNWSTDIDSPMQDVEERKIVRLPCRRQFITVKPSPETPDIPMTPITPPRAVTPELSDVEMTLTRPRTLYREEEFMTPTKPKVKVSRPQLKPLITPPILKSIKEFEGDTPLSPARSSRYSGTSERSHTPISPWDDTIRQRDI